MDEKGNIFNIQHFCVHDGPEIRDVVFMKGCPLRCQWCANPESQKKEFQVAYSRNKCIGCGSCIKLCPQQAIEHCEDGKIKINKDRCVECQICVKGCCSKALHTFGKLQTVEETYQELQRQAGAWRVSSGVTVSGGEPLQQSDFVAALLRRLKSAGIHTAIETSGFAPWENFQKVARYCDLVIMDVKIYDAEKHKQYTGVDNALILENLRRLRKEMPTLDVLVRTPVIPGINDTKEELQEIVNFIQEILPVNDYELLPYHNFGAAKYEQLFSSYVLSSLTKPDKNAIRELNNEFRRQLNLTER